MGRFIGYGLDKILGRESVKRAEKHSWMTFRSNARCLPNDIKGEMKSQRIGNITT